MKGFPMLITSGFTMPRPSTTRKPVSQPDGPLFSGNRSLEQVKALEEQCLAEGMNAGQLAKLKKESRILPQKKNDDVESLNKLYGDDIIISRKESNRVSQGNYRKKNDNYIAAMKWAIERKKQGLVISEPDVFASILKNAKTIAKQGSQAEASENGSQDQFTRQKTGHSPQQPAPSQPTHHTDWAENEAINPFASHDHAIHTALPIRPLTPPVSDAFLKKLSWHENFEGH
jgi:hypothetical protein